MKRSNVPWAATAILALPLIGCGTLAVQIHDVRIDHWEDDGAVVRVTTDADLVSLERTKWAAVVMLPYSVDDNVPVRGKVEDTIGYRRPFLAQFVRSGNLEEGRHESFWKVRIKDAVSEDKADFTYDLEDGKAHAIECEIYGAGNFTFSSLTSNAVKITIPERLCD